MALSDIGLCSRALIKIGAAPISSFEDGSAQSEIAGALYEQVRDSLLSAYAWSFATGQIELAQLSEAPTADFTYAYELPTDFLRALSAGNGLRGRGINYRIMSGKLHTNASEVILTYIYRPDEESFPPYFDSVLITKLAAEFAIPITENTSRSERLYKQADGDFQRARQIDAQQDTPNRIEDFTLINVRE
ncbi:MAG: hypothetical protein KAJ40_00520 [Alphaproteobacteria bacterium]|nr:hypothetical protein [Alphaproteobacteria bacterium]